MRMRPHKGCCDCELAIGGTCFGGRKADGNSMGICGGPFVGGAFDFARGKPFQGGQSDVFALRARDLDLDLRSVADRDSSHATIVPFFASANSTTEFVCFAIKPSNEAHASAMERAAAGESLGLI